MTCFVSNKNFLNPKDYEKMSFLTLKLSVFSIGTKYDKSKIEMLNQKL